MVAWNDQTYLRADVLDAQLRSRQLRMDISTQIVSFNDGKTRVQIKKYYTSDHFEQPLELSVVNGEFDKKSQAIIAEVESRQVGFEETLTRFCQSFQGLNQDTMNGAIDYTLDLKNVQGHSVNVHVVRDGLTSSFNGIELSTKEAVKKDPEGFYLTRNRFMHLIQILKGSSYIPSGARRTIVQLLNRYDYQNRSLCQIYEQPTSFELNIERKYRAPVLQLLLQHEAELVNEGEQVENPFLLRNRQLNPALLAFFRSNMSDDVDLSYPISEVLSVPFEVTGSISQEDFQERMRYYDSQTDDITKFVVYCRGRRIDQSFKYGCSNAF